MLIKTAVKEEENRRLRLKLQSYEVERKGFENGSASKGLNEDKAAADRTKPEAHTLSHGAERDLHAETQRLEQKGHVVGQLKRVMEQVLDFAVSELTKIVEASFDDLLQEMIRKEREHVCLSEKLCSLDRQDSSNGGASRRRSSDKDFPCDSEDTRDDSRNVTTKITHDTDKQTVLTVAQDWVPILDKVFGQKWCSDLWQIQGKGSGEKSSGLGLEGSIPSLHALIRDNLESSPTCPQQEPRWMPLEDMDVLSTSPDSKDSSATVMTTAKPGESLRSPSMLHRLLTLPAQLLEEDEINAETAPATESAPDGAGESRRNADSPNQIWPRPPKRKSSVALEEEDNDLDKGTNTLCSELTTPEPPKGRKAHECRQCGKKFSRTPLLKAHQQMHVTTAPAKTPVIYCSECGKCFSQASRLQVHLRTHSGKTSGGNGKL
ncbi:hypothetical protein UPYG_G00093550 [Umbra pygmaea]|uniref:C2H2-type domain-containing protein n=1 Tax=Umbra pygmaea TaxID=75934 RepID=A0ABD0XP62_UMBPY